MVLRIQTQPYTLMLQALHRLCPNPPKALRLNFFLHWLMGWLIVCACMPQFPGLVVSTLLCWEIPRGSESPICKSFCSSGSFPLSLLCKPSSGWWQWGDKAVGLHKVFPMAFSGGKCLKRLVYSEYVSVWVDVHRGQKRMSDPLELELWVSCQIRKPRAKLAGSALSYWTISSPL